MKWTTKRKIAIHCIGIAGAYRGIGVTHIALAVANYMASIQCQKTLYIKVGEEMGLRDVVGEKRTVINGRLAYLYRNVNYMLNATEKVAIEEMKKWKGVVVLDIDQANIRLLSQCQRKVLLISNSPWRKKEEENFIKEYIEDILSVSIFENERIENRKYDGCINRIENPFMLKEKEFATIEKIIYE